MEKVERIAFIDNKDQASGYLTAGSGLAVAMTPSAFNCLRKGGAQVSNTLSYFDSESHKRILKKSEEAASWLEEKASFADMGTGVKEMYRRAFHFYTRFAVHHCLWCIEIIMNAVERHSPDIIMASSTEENLSDVYVRPDDGYLGYIARNIAKMNGLEFEGLAGGCFAAGRKSKTNESPLRLIAKYIKFRLWQSSLTRMEKKAKRRAILFTTPNYAMDRLKDDLEKEMPEEIYSVLKGPIMPHSGISASVVRLLWPAYAKKIEEQRRLFDTLLVDIKRSADIFSYHGTSFKEILSRKFRSGIFGYTIGAMLWSVELRRFIDSVNPSCIVSAGNRLDEMAFTELGALKNIPTLLISHGSAVPIKNEFERIEWGSHGKTQARASFSHIALQSPMAEEYLRTFPAYGNTVRTGPLLWGRPIAAIKNKPLFDKLFNGLYDISKTKIIVHAGTPKANNSLRPFVYETSDEYIKALCDLAKVVERIPGAVLIIRFREGSEISIEDIRNMVPFSDKVVLSTEEKFLDVLSLTDLLVSFSSTAIEEALQNRIPVLLYGGGGRYQHLPAFSLDPKMPVTSSSVYHVKDEDNLRWAVETILSLGINRENGRALFRPYRYEDDETVRLSDLVRGLLYNREKRSFDEPCSNCVSIS